MLQAIYAMRKTLCRHWELRDADRNFQETCRVEKTLCERRADDANIADGLKQERSKALGYGSLDS